jgi:hypothetical protein
MGPPVSEDSGTTEAVGDWRYWVARGYKFWPNPQLDGDRGGSGALLRSLRFRSPFSWSGWASWNGAARIVHVYQESAYHET